MVIDEKGPDGGRWGQEVSPSLSSHFGQTVMAVDDPPGVGSLGECPATSSFPPLPLQVRQRQWWGEHPVQCHSPGTIATLVI